MDTINAEVDILKVSPTETRGSLVFDVVTFRVRGVPEIGEDYEFDYVRIKEH